MNERQRRFVEAYIACRNAAAAARLIGYSKRAATSAGYRHLGKPAVIAALRDAGIETGDKGELLHRGWRDAAGLNQRQRRFVAEYRLSRNAHDAARRAGYAKRSAHTMGSRQLRHKAVIAALSACGVPIVRGVHPREQHRKQRKPFVKQALTARQRLFVEAYLVLGNASQAAIRAGLSARYPGASAQKMLRDPVVAAVLERERAKLAERTQIDAARVVEEYARIAFANLADIIDWGPGGVSLKPDATLTARDGAAVLEITLGEGEAVKRVHIKMQPKLKALDALARHFGIGGKGAAPSAAPAPDKEARDARRARVLRMAGALKAERAKKKA